MTDDLGKKITDLGKSIWGKAQDTVDIVSMNSEIATKKHALTELYAEIGRLFCTNHAEMALNECPDKANQALSLAKDVKALEEKVLLKKGNRKCPACSATVSSEAVYCPACGFQLPPFQTQEQQEEQSPRYCKECGAILDRDDQFCQSCGKKQEDN